MSGREAENLFLNAALRGAAGEHGLPAGFSLAPYEHGVHFWKLEVGVEAHVEVVPVGGPDGRAALRVAHQEFRLLDAWDDFLPRPGYVQWVGIRPDIAAIAPAPVDRLFRLVYRGRSEGDGYVHARIQGPNLQNDPESIAWQPTWRTIDHTFILDADETLDSVYFYVKVSEPGDLVELADFDLRYEGEFKPVTLRPRPRLERLPDPREDTVIQVNPPTFVWPDAVGDLEYDLEISPSPDFSRDVLRYGPLRFNFHKPTVLLGAGRHFWRWRRTDGRFSEPIAFTMPHDAVEYLTPSFDEVFAHLRREHPRLLVTRETLDAFRRTVTRDNAEVWRSFLGRIDEPLRVRLDFTRTDESYHIAQNCHRLWNHAFAFLVTDEAAHADAARELLAEVLRVPVEGITAHRHSELNHNLVKTMSMGYDWLYDVLPEEERERTREALARRIGNIYAFYKANRSPFHSFERCRYDSHGSYMMQTILTGALAIAGEVPGAEKWMEYWLMANISFYPPWSVTDGSWAQGIHYGACYVDANDIPEAWMVRSATGLNLFEKPFFRCHRDWLLYAYPPFGMKTPFGDLARKDRSDETDLARFGRIARALAVERQDPYAEWYARAALGRKGLWHGHELMVPGAPDVAPKPPDDLPRAKLFPDTGWVFMHTDLTGRDDVSLAFKSSPYGSLSHSHADQNSFVLSRGDRWLLSDAGYYAGYGTPHHLGFYKHSRGHNTILVKGRGQLINEAKAGGHITHFAHTDEIDYTVGDAQAAYGNLLERFDRHVVFLRPNLFVIFDDVIATGPSTIDWLLHAPQPIEVDEAARVIETRNGASFARIHLRGPEELVLTTTDRFDPAPPERFSRYSREPYKDEFHFCAHAPRRTKQSHFLAVIAVGESSRREGLVEPSFVEDASWTGVETSEGAVFFRTGEGQAVVAGGRRMETDARALVLRPSGTFLLADATRLKVDGRTVFKSAEPVGTHTGRLA
ncbi:MAG TPA: DUF4962 domain-containing protein [Planctomycetota bacterium]|nr:DUF4962 domain-containing protein [Planctomycetota bacterium]